MKKILIIIVGIFSGYFVAFSQEDKTTEITRDWHVNNDIELLNSKYDIDKVKMDEVYIIRNGQMQPILSSASVSSSATTVNGVDLNIPEAGEVAAESISVESAPAATNNESVSVATEDDVVVQTSSTAQSNSVVQTNSTAAKSSTSSYKKTPQVKRKKIKTKRVKLKKRKYKKYKGKSCFRF